MRSADRSAPRSLRRTRRGASFGISQGDRTAIELWLVFVLRGHLRTALCWSLVGASAPFQSCNVWAVTVRTETRSSHRNYPVFLSTMRILGASARLCSCGFGTAVAIYGAGCAGSIRLWDGSNPSRQRRSGATSTLQRVHLVESVVPKRLWNMKEGGAS